jgi:hypothetical protein
LIPLLGGRFRARGTDIAAFSCRRSSGWRSLSLWSRLGTGDRIGDHTVARIQTDRAWEGTLAFAGIRLLAIPEIGESQDCGRRPGCVLLR